MDDPIFPAAFDEAAPPTALDMEVLRDALCAVADGVALFEADGTPILRQGALHPLDGGPGSLFAQAQRVRDRFRADLGGGWPEVAAAEIEGVLDTVMMRFDASPAAGAAGAPAIEASWLRLPRGRRLLLQRDMTAQRRRHAALERTHALLRTVLDTMQDGVLLVDANEVCRYANTAALAMHDCTAERIRGLPTFRELVQEQFARGEFGPPPAMRFVEEVLRRFRAARGDCHACRRSNGTWIEVSYHRVREGGTLAVFRDITALRRQQTLLECERDAAQAANHAKSAFLATMNHEIRTPMNGIIGLLDLLEGQTLTEGQGPLVATMRESAITLLRIVNDVLDLSKIEAGKLELEEAPFSLASLVAGAAAALRPRAVSRGLTLTERVEGDPDLLLGDATRVRQILFNLLGNAIKFTERGSVSLVARSTWLPEGRARVELDVSDTGAGIAPDVLPRLFSPFTQGDASTTRRFGGTGLGLSIVRRLSELMDGAAEVQSEPGEGARFRITLHLHPAPAGSVIGPPADAAPAPAALGAGRVLVVDDHPVNRDVLLGQLAMLGVQADAAGDGVEALARWADIDYAIVLSDLHMPVLDGFEFVRRLRGREQVERRRRTPIVAVTANTLAGEPERCAEADMDGFVAKPVTIARLRAALARWLPLAAPGQSQTGPAAVGPAVEPAALAAWLGDDRAAVRGLLDRFLANARAAESDLVDALAARPPDVAGMAHRLKGAALAVGACGVAAAASELERAVGAGDASTCRTAIAALGDEIRRLAAELAGAAG